MLCSATVLEPFAREIVMYMFVGVDISFSFSFSSLFFRFFSFSKRVLANSKEE